MPKGASTEEPAAPAPAPAPAPAATAAAAAPAAARAAPRRPAPAPAPAPATATKAQSDAYYAGESDRSTYLEAIGRVEELRRMGQIGKAPRPDVLFGKPAAQYASMQPMTISAASRPVPLGASLSQREPMVVRPTQAPTRLTPEELLVQTRSQLAARAMAEGKQFSAAIGAYRQSADATDAAVRSPDVAKATFPALAAEQRKRLEAVLNLAAQMREYGFVGSNEELMDRFAPK